MHKRTAMYFTHNDNLHIKAIYSGRFAYICLSDVGLAIKKYKSLKGDSSKAGEELLEEYRHFRVFLYSISGLYVNGLRWVVRILYSIFNKYDIAYDYYKSRSIFFGLAYEFHEKTVSEGIVKWLELLKLDVKIIYESAKNSMLYSVFLPFFPIIALIGLVISYHFTVRVIDEGSDNKREVNISKYGYAGVSNEENMNVGISFFGKLIQIEKHLGSGSHELWFLAKFSAEKDMWEKYKDNFKFASNNTYEEYIEKLIVFIEAWFHGTGSVLKHVRSLLLSPSIENYAVMKERIKGIDRYIWFSYAHGN